jgi:ipoprotein LpqH
VNRLIATAVATVGCASALVACSSAHPASNVSTGGGASVKVAGSDLAGLDPNSVTCVKQAGKINIGSGMAGGQQGLAVVMTDEATPKVEHLAVFVDGNMLSVSTTPVKLGSANVAVDGKTYTISGQAQGADIKNPMAGQISKEFTVKVTCG